LLGGDFGGEAIEGIVWSENNGKKHCPEVPAEEGGYAEADEEEIIWARGRIYQRPSQLAGCAYLVKFPSPVPDESGTTSPKGEVREAYSRYHAG
jgi:hypothetical protein